MDSTFILIASTVGDAPLFSAPTPSSSSEKGAGLSSGATVGVIVVAAILLSILAACYYFMLLRRKMTVERLSNGYTTLETSFTPISGLDRGEERFFKISTRDTPSTIIGEEGEEGFLMLQSNDDDYNL